MLELAEHIIRTKAGRFDPKAFDDRYESALAELVKAKIEGRKIKPVKRPEPAKVVDLLDALRQSAKAGKSGKSADRSAAKRKPARKTEPRRKAG
jgi:DNA end-binding protein Ku